MVEITHKKSSLRIATASAEVKVSKQETIDAILNKTVPKGDVFEMAKTAGLFAVKRTSDMIPDCHPMPVEFTSVNYKVEGLSVFIEMTVKTIYKTGVEVEAMHGVSVVALTMYDMLKPIDKGIEIHQIKLLAKKGGKTDFVKMEQYKKLTAAVVVCSDTISAGLNEDKSGKTIVSILKDFGVQVTEYTVIPDEIPQIREELFKHVKNATNMLIYTGGTGLSLRDVTPEALIPELDRRIPGIEEAIRNYGQDRTPYSMLSRSVVGVKEKTLVLALPGSTKGAKESMEAIFPEVMHIFNIFKGTRHD
jgi:cyclic pyranopterin monophosphate synthase